MERYFDGYIVPGGDVQLPHSFLRDLAYYKSSKPLTFTEWHDLIDMTRRVLNVRGLLSLIFLIFETASSSLQYLGENVDKLEKRRTNKRSRSGVYFNYTQIYQDFFNKTLSELSVSGRKWRGDQVSIKTPN